MLPPEVVTLLQSAFPGQPLGDFAPTSGGFSNLTAIVSIGDQRCVIKAAVALLKRDDVRREAALLRLLSAADLPIPRLLALIESEEWTVAVTGWLPGEHGLAVLERAPEQLEAVYGALGLLLANVHRTTAIRVPSPPAPLPAAGEGSEFSPLSRSWERGCRRSGGGEGVSEPQLEDRMRHALTRLPTLPLEDDLRAVLQEALQHPIWRAQPYALIHGDAGLHNLLWDGRITALLDWEWAGWGTPLLDLAWVFWTIQWRRLPPALWDSLLAGYDAGPALTNAATPDEMRALALGQIAGILVRSHGQPSAWEEWQRRLGWTTGIAFPML